ncbi:MAG: chorismate-binding protein [Micrococcaceae bacterium]
MKTKIYSATTSVSEEFFNSALKADFDYLWARTDTAINAIQKIGFGSLISHETFGSERISELENWWHNVSHETSEKITAFSSISFDAESNWGAKLTIPDFLLEKTSTGFTLTSYSLTEKNIELATKSLYQTAGKYQLVDTSLSDIDWKQIVAKAVNAMKNGELEKVVLSRNLSYKADTEVFPNAVAQKLLADYPQCWTYQYENFVGATPELLIEIQNNKAKARVLAGTQARNTKNGKEILINSNKEQKEHAFAVDSLVKVLEPRSTKVNVNGPFALELPNVWHLASDITATLKAPLEILKILEKIHPTAAVGGTPTTKAVELIKKLENYDRGPYAGPIGWLNNAGEGQFGIGLRGGIIDGKHIELYAGGGIVVDSIPKNELNETRAKLVPMQNALNQALNTN